MQILGRAAKRAAKAGSNKLAQAYDALADKLDACRPRRRCGSLACPKCARAFQTAKVAAQRRLIKKLAKARSGKQLVMASVIPLSQEAEAPRRGNPSRREFRDIASGDRGRPPLADTTRCAGAGCAAFSIPLAFQQASPSFGRLGPEHDWRLSFCCAVDGCRTRATPPSLRFVGRKVYLATIVVLVAIMQECAPALLRHRTAVGGAVGQGRGTPRDRGAVGTRMAPPTTGEPIHFGSSISGHRLATTRCADSMKANARQAPACHGAPERWRRAVAVDLVGNRRGNVKRDCARRPRNPHGRRVGSLDRRHIFRDAILLDSKRSCTYL